MKHFAPFLLFVFFSFSLPAQNKLLLKIAKEISQENIKKDLYQLSSEEMQGRETGTSGQKLAAQYIYKQFYKAGIYNKQRANDSIGYFQQFPVYKIMQPSAKIKNQKNDFLNYKDILVSGYSDYSKQEMKINFLGNAEDSCFIGKDFSNQATLFLTPNLYSGFSKSNDIIKETGAKCVFFCNPNSPHQLQQIIANQKSKNPKRLKLDPKLFPVSIPFDSISHPKIYKQYKIATTTYQGPVETNVASKLLQIKVRDLRKHLAGKKTVKHLNPDSKIDFSFTQNYKEVKTENVIAYIPGTSRKDEFIILTAHYDHVGKTKNTTFFGANDNASGTAALIEIARTFQKAKNSGLENKRSILFLACTGEEKGMLGSRYFVANCAIPYDKIKANLNLDMLGRLDRRHKNNRYIYLLGASDINPKLKSISDSINSIYPKFDLDYSYDQKDNFLYAASDQASFVSKDIPAIFYFNGLHNDYHKSSDTPDKINIQSIKEVAGLVFLTAWEIANRMD